MAMTLAPYMALICAPMVGKLLRVRGFSRKIEKACPSFAAAEVVDMIWVVS